MAGRAARRPSGESLYFVALPDRSRRLSPTRRVGLYQRATRAGARRKGQRQRGGSWVRAGKRYWGLRRFWVVLTLLSLLGGMLPQPGVAAEQASGAAATGANEVADARYFPETQHVISG